MRNVIWSVLPIHKSLHWSSSDYLIVDTKLDGWTSVNQNQQAKRVNEITLLLQATSDNWSLGLFCARQRQANLKEESYIGKSINGKSTNHNKPQMMVNQTYKIHTFLSVLTDCVFGFTVSLTFWSDEFDIIYKNLFHTSQYIYI